MGAWCLRGKPPDPLCFQRALQRRYVAFDDGSRAVTRMDHAPWDLSPDMIPGVVVTYVSAGGTTLQVRRRGCWCARCLGRWEG